MNPNASRLVLRQRSPLSSFDICLRLIHANTRAYLLTTTILVVPGVLLSIPLLYLTEGHWAVGLLFFLLSGALQGPFTILSGKLLFVEEVSLKELASSSYGQLGALFQNFLVDTIGWVLFTLSCGLFWLISGVGLAFTPETLLLERLPMIRALTRGTRLASAHPGNAFAAATARIGITLWMIAVCETGGYELLSFVLQLGAPMGSAWDGLVTPWVILGIGLAQPLIAVYRLMLYVDLRTRVEGWDLQVALRAAGLNQ